MVRRFNNVEGVALNLVSSYFAGVDIYDSVGIIEQLTLQEVNGDRMGLPLLLKHLR